MKKALIILLALGILAATNPDVRDHRDAVKQQIATATGQNPEAFVFDALVSTSLKRVVYRQNFIIFSLTQIHTSGSTHTIGIGMCTKVFIYKHSLIPLIQIR